MSVSKVVHMQNTPSANWVVQHNLGVLTPIVELVVNGEIPAEKIYPLDILYLDQTSVEIVWSRPYVGTATIVG